jgi:hypothetical protein
VSLAVPLNDGVVSREGDGGPSRVTFGGFVSIVNVYGAVTLVSWKPNTSVCSATAV